MSFLVFGLGAGNRVVNLNMVFLLGLRGRTGTQAVYSESRTHLSRPAL